MASKMKRRDFLKTSVMATLPITLGGLPIFSSVNNVSETFFDPENDNILVLIQLQGGNDGLATVYNYNSYSQLQQVRSNIIVPQNAILNLGNNFGLHPAMTGLQENWEKEKLGIIQNVGYPNQNRSHFRSTDIWHTASDSQEFLNTGWIGRMYDEYYDDFPSAYPNPSRPDPFALTIGRTLSSTCQGTTANYSLAVTDPFNPGTALVGEGGNIPNNCYGDALTFVNDTVAQTNAYAEVILQAANSGNNLSNLYNDGSVLSQQLKNVARLISGGLTTKIYVVQLGGFDTHDGQVEQDTTTGWHSYLLDQLSSSISAFQDDLEQLGISDKVVGMTYSEFGRRIRSNSANGTDHGNAAPMILFGDCISQQVLGDYPEIDTAVSPQEGVPMQFDFRNVYGTILEQWLGVKESEVLELIYDNYNVLSLFDPSCLEMDEPDPPPPVVDDVGDLIIYNNPVQSRLAFEFPGHTNGSRVTLMDVKGAVVFADVVDGDGNQVYNLNMTSFGPGVYFIHVSNNDFMKTKRIVRV